MRRYIGLDVLNRSRLTIANGDRQSADEEVTTPAITA